MGHTFIGDDSIRQRLRLGQDSYWEFKPFEFCGNTPISPSREDLADELGAFANSVGGFLLCGVSDDGQIQGMSREQMAALDRLLVEISTDAIEPALRIAVQHRKLQDKSFLLVEVFRGGAVHERAGNAFIRVGAAKFRLADDERLRLAQRKTQSRFRWFENQTVPQTGFETLSERLWEPLLSIAGATDPRLGLMNFRLLAQDEAGINRATVAGILLCAKKPQTWFPHATIAATHYRGQDRASGQLDAQEIVGSLPVQIADAVKFVVRNMQVSARKPPERVEMPQYSETAIFEAIVNAVAHRDYSISSRRIRLSMFKNRLEIESPGQLPNGLTIEGMETGQATRNEVIVSVFGRIPVRDLPGTADRLYLMDRRGDGVSVILRETREIAGVLPEYKVIDDSSLVLTIPAAKLELSPADATITVHSKGDPLSGVDVLALFPNKTWLQATTSEAGEATFDLYTTHLPMNVYAAAPGYAAGLAHEWKPDEGGLLLELNPLPSGGSVVFATDTGHLPGLRGRLNPIRDSSDRTYLYADNIAIDEGKQQPVAFRFGKSMRLTDAYGAELLVTVVDIVGRSALVQYQKQKA